MSFGPLEAILMVMNPRLPCVIYGPAWRTTPVQRCYFGEAAALPLAPEPPLTKRQRRRLRGKSKASR